MIDEAGRRDCTNSRRQIAFMEKGRVGKWHGQPINLTRWEFTCLMTLVYVPS